MDVFLRVRWWGFLFVQDSSLAIKGKDRSSNPEFTWFQGRKTVLLSSLFVVTSCCCVVMINLAFVRNKETFLISVLKFDKNVSLLI